MNKNLIFTTAINHNTSEFQNTLYSDYCIKSWSAWCKKNDIDFLVIDKHNERYKYPVWNKDIIFEIVGDKYDKLGYVDSDTMVHWNAPNPFELYDDEFCWVKDNGNLRWNVNSINIFQQFYPNQKLSIYDYYNSGVYFFTKDHKSIFDELIKLYENNKDNIDGVAKMGGGKVQTILNFQLKKQNIKVKELPVTWNMLHMHRKEMFSHNWQDGEDKTPFFIKYTNIWHFTGFSIEDRIKIMRDTWNMVGKNYDYTKYDDILSLTQHRHQNKNATSVKFKTDILDIFLNDKYKNKTLVEIGCHQGNSTKYLSKIFKKVYAVDKWHLDTAKNHCKDCDNVEFIKANLYDYSDGSGTYCADKWEDFLPSKVDVVFIDAGHEYYQVKQDIENALKMWPDVEFIFDDYGLPPGEVKAAIDEKVNEGVLKINKFIGESPENIVTTGKKFTDNEGCVCNLQ